MGPSIRSCLQTLTALACLALAAPPARAVDTPTLSGLPWRSGADGDYDIGGWRGRPLDVRVVFIGHKTWSEMISKTGGKYFQKTCNWTPFCIISLAMFPDNVRYKFSECSAGMFDENFRRMGENITAARSTGVAIRIGWEANGPDGRPYHIRTTADVGPYKACFRRIAGVLKSVNPNFLIDWSNAKKGSLPINVMDTYPGDDVVDIMSVHYYDSGPRKMSQAIWDDYANRTYNGGPWGINTWLAVAREHGKKLGVPEWGVWRNGRDPGSPDNPVYIDNMYQFFRNNAADIAYESYHNMGKDHRLYPSSPFARAASEYRLRWQETVATGGDDVPPGGTTP